MKRTKNIEVSSDTSIKGEYDEMVDISDLGSDEEIRGGSSPSIRMKKRSKEKFVSWKLRKTLPDNSI